MDIIHKRISESFRDGINFAKINTHAIVPVRFAHHHNRTGIFAIRASYEPLREQVAHLGMHLAFNHMRYRVMTLLYGFRRFENNFMLRSRSTLQRAFRLYENGAANNNFILKRKFVSENLKIT